MTLLKSKLPILAIIALYFYLYNPIFRSGFAFGTLFIVLAFVYTFAHFSKVAQYVKYYRPELVLSIVVALYVTLVCMVSGEESSIPKTMLIWILVSTIVPVSLVCVFFSGKNIIFWDVILDVGFIASLLSCAALFVPSFNEFLRNIQVDTTQSGGLALEQLGFRGFGFAFYLTSAYGYVQGLLAALCLLRLDKKHWHFVVYFITMTVSVLINARTGLVPIALALLYIVVSSVMRFKVGTIFKYALWGCVTVFVIFQMLNLFPDVKDFVFDFFDQLELMFVDEEFEDSAYSKMLVFPDSTTGLIFGEGHDIFGSEEHVMSSDIGYINQIFIGGIVFAVALVVYEVVVFVKILKRSEDKVFPTVFFLSMLVFNYKGVAFYSYVSYVVLWMLYYYVLVHNQLFPSHPIKLR